MLKSRWGQPLRIMFDWPQGRGWGRCLSWGRLRAFILRGAIAMRFWAKKSGWTRYRGEAVRSRPGRRAWRCLLGLVATLRRGLTPWRGDFSGKLAHPFMSIGERVT